MRTMCVGRSTPRAELPERAVLSHDVRHAEQPTTVLARKGSLVERAELIDLMQHIDAELHLAVPEPTDITEDDAALRLARAVAGEGVRVDQAHFGQVTLTSDFRGMVRVEASRLDAVNAQPGVLVLTSLPDVATDEETPLGVVKCAPLLLDSAVLMAVENIRASLGPVIEVQAFRRRSVAFVAPAGRVRGNAFQSATTSLSKALDWYGSSLEATFATGTSASAVADGFRDALHSGADLIMAAGAAATDPIDLVFEGLRQAGGEVDQIGIPAEPGTACWIGQLDGCAVLGLASCELFGRPGALDLLLPRILSGETLDRQLLLRVARGGLLVGGPSRVPPYHTA